MAGYLFPLDVLRFLKMQKVAKSHSVCAKTMRDGIPDEGSLGYNSILNQEASRSNSDSETEDSAPRIGRGGPRHDEHGKGKSSLV